MKIRSMCCTLAVTLCAVGAQAQPPAGNAVPVTVDNFIRAESDFYIGNLAKEAAVLGSCMHRREPAAIDNQTVIRLNRDTLYSSAVFDLDAGPVTITLPDAGTRFMSMQVDQSGPLHADGVYGAGPHTIDRDKVGTRYAAVGDPHAGRSGGPEGHRAGPCVAGCDQGQPAERRHASRLPNWDQASQKKVRDALLVLGSTTPDFKQGVRHQGAGRSGAAPDRHGGRPGAAIPTRTPPISTSRQPKNDGKTVYQPQRRERAGRRRSGRSASTTPRAIFEKNPYNAYTLNNLTAKKAATARSPSSSAAATARSRTACRS